MHAVHNANTRIPTFVNGRFLQRDSLIPTFNRKRFRQEVTINKRRTPFIRLRSTRDNRAVVRKPSGCLSIRAIASVPVGLICPISIRRATEDQRIGHIANGVTDAFGVVVSKATRHASSVKHCVQLCLANRKVRHLEGHRTRRDERHRLCGEFIHNQYSTISKLQIYNFLRQFRKFGDLQLICGLSRPVNFLYES